MNTEIRRIIEKIKNDQKELERLINERTAIMKSEHNLSTRNFRREISIIEDFIKRKSEEIMNGRRNIENYTHASDLMRELDQVPSSEEERNETEEELNSVMETLPTELQQELINRENNEQIEENTPQVSNEERLRTLQEALEVARNAYQASLDNFQTIFSNERNEIVERGPLNNEELDELNSRYLSAKEAENERLQRSRELIAEIESGINNLNEVIEQERKTQEITPGVVENEENKNEHSSLEASNEYQSMPTEKALVPVPEKGLVPIIPINPNKIKAKDKNTTIPIEKSLVPVQEPEATSKKQERGFYTIINELTEGLNIEAKTGKKYKASNIKVSKEFKEELKSGNYLYNIVHLVPTIIKVPIKLIRKAINRIRYSIEEKQTVATLKERISNLDEDDLKVIWEEYRGTKVIEERYPDILNILLNERIQQYAMEKVTSLNSSMEEKYKELFEAKKTVDKCNEILSEINTDGDQELIKEVIEKRENALAGKAEMIKKLREEYKEANQWLSGGAHGFEEDMKAATTKLSIVGKRFVKERNLDPEITKRQAEIEQKEMTAIRNNDDESALNAFIENEVLLSSNTEFERSVFGTRSSGAKYYEPTIVKSDYRDDPFIRDLFTTVATTGAIISTISAINVHGAQADELLKNHQDEVAQANANNDTIIDNVHEQGAKLTDNSSDFAEGIKTQAESNVVNHTNTVERQTLDQTSWQIGSSNYRTVDSAAHEAYNGMADSVESRINDIASQYSSGTITRGATLDMLKDVANETQQNLVDLYNAYLPTLKEYASSHPQFDLHGVEEAMEFVSNHPGAIAKMNEGMVESVQIGENLSALSAEHIEAINSLPSDLRTTLFADGAAAVALAYTVAKDMDKNEKSGKYGNSVTDMVSEYIADKENNNVETNTSSKSK